MKLVKYKCDIEGCENTLEESQHGKLRDVVFNTEQTEGRGVKPYLSKEHFDLCDNCLQRLIDEFPIVGSGAQGYNTFRFVKGAKADGK